MDSQLASTIQLLQGEASMDGGWTQYQANQGRKYFRGNRPTDDGAGPAADAPAHPPTGTGRA
jgi:hypothetical protein